MPKIKTNRGAAKRFKLTASGKVKRTKQGRRHILTTKDRAKKNSMKRPGLVSAADVGNIKKLIPYC